MTVYLSSPTTQLQCSLLRDMPVLISFATWSPMINLYQSSFSQILIDSGAFSEFKSGKAIDLDEYRDWSEQWRERADAIAGLDNISGDYRISLKNYARIPWSFPTFHYSDPPELLNELTAIALERDNWLGIGLVPPVHAKRNFLERTLDEIPASIKAHVFSGREYAYLARIDSTDSTNWWRSAARLMANADTRHLTPAECMDIVVKRHQRWKRTLKPNEAQQKRLFDD